MNRPALRFPSRQLLACLAVLLAAVSTPAQSVLVVGPAGFPGLKQAVAAANEGDIILVQDGYFDMAPVVIDGKSLSIVAEGAATQNAWTDLPMPASIEIRNLAANQSVTIRGIAFRTFPVQMKSGAYVHDCKGAVVFENCILQPKNGIGLDVEASASVTVRNCTLSGGFGLSAIAGLRVHDSRVQLYSSTVLGGDGSDAKNLILLVEPNGHGGDAALISGKSNVLASGVSFQGGNGGSPGTFCFPGGDAGNGLVLGNGNDAPVLRLRDFSFAAGTPSAGTCGYFAGAEGTAAVVFSGIEVPLPGVSRDLELTSPATAGDNVTFSFSGEPGDAAMLLLSLHVAPAVGVKQGTSLLHLALPLTIVPLALPGGDLDLSWSVPGLPVGLEGLSVAAQAVFVNGEQFVTSGPTLGVFLAP